MPDVRPELIEKATLALTNDRRERHGLSRIDRLPWVGTTETEKRNMRAALEAIADDLRAEGAAEALRKAADALDAYDATNPPPTDDRWTCDLGYYGEAAWLRARADQIAGADQ